MRRRLHPSLPTLVDETAAVGTSEETPVIATSVSPAIWQLVRFQALAKCRRLIRGFTNPRRMMWSIVAAMLAAFWLSNATMSILFRESAGIDRFRHWVPLGLLLYALWHVVKVVFQRPEEGLDWTPAERELLCGGPFRRPELIIYRLCGVANAGLVKAALFTVLMLPDLSLYTTGFLGTFLALIFLDLIRIGVEVMANGISNSAYVRLRASTAVILGTIVTSSLIIAWSTPVTWKPGPIGLSLGLIAHVFKSSASLAETPLGAVLLAPFEVFAQLITATSYSTSTIGWLVLAMGMVGGSLIALIRLDQFFFVAQQRRERRLYPPASLPQQATDAAKLDLTLPNVPWLFGAGSVAWRQMVGALKQRSSLMFALALPGILACLPIIVYPNGKQAVLNVAGALTFYTFLLLPSALKFDFRRDIQRMIVLKTLPIRPAFLVIGQVVTPVMLAFVFQLIVLTITLVARPYPPWMMFAILSLMLPMNVLIFSLDNLIYLLYPYRLNQEGIEIFLRTTLTFTAKGVLFGIAVTMTFGWSFAANFLSRHLLGSPNHAASIFVIGAVLMLCGASALILHALSLAFVRFDPSQDTPA